VNQQYLYSISIFSDSVLGPGLQTPARKIFLVGWPAPEPGGRAKKGRGVTRLSSFTGEPWKIGEIPDAWGSASVPYRFYPLISGSGGTGALKRQVPMGSITEECSRANPGGWGLSTESLLCWERPPCIATTVSSPKGQGRIQFRRGTTADPDPVEYLLRLTILTYWQGKNFYELVENGLQGKKEMLIYQIKICHLLHENDRGIQKSAFP